MGHAGATPLQRPPENRKDVGVCLVDTPYKLYNVAMSGKVLIKYLQERGWVVDRIRGSHFIMVKAGHRPGASAWTARFTRRVGSEHSTGSNGGIIDGRTGAITMLDR